MDPSVKLTTVPEHLAKYKDIKIFDPPTNAEHQINADVMIIGDIEIDSDEMSVLTLPPDFATLANLDEESFIHEEEMAMTKLRWEKKKMIEEDLGEENIELTEQEKERIDIEDAQKRQIFDPINKVLDLRRRRVTDLKENSKVYLPKPLPSNEEAKI